MEIKNKILNLLTKIVTWALVVFTVFIMVFTVFTVATFDKNDRPVFGYRFYIVRSDSMSESELNKDQEVHFDAGDIIVVKIVDDPTSLEAGDIISFVSMNEDSYLETITHRIRSVKENSNGQVLGYVTYGTNKDVNDEALVEPAHVLGVYSTKLPVVGRFFAFVKSTPGYIICILIPFLLLILYNGMNVIRLFKQYRREQLDAINAEKEKIEAERAENQRMMQELLLLKKQLEQQNSEGTPSEKPASEA